MPIPWSQQVRRLVCFVTEYYCQWGLTAALLLTSVLEVYMLLAGSAVEYECDTHLVVGEQIMVSTAVFNLLRRGASRIERVVM